jgi:hypothetical protein
MGWHYLAILAVAAGLYVLALFTLYGKRLKRNMALLNQPEE